MMDTDQVPAGRELDALVAEKVMGWSRKTGLDGWDDMWPPEEDGNIERRVTAPSFDGLPHYSTDITAAWKVVENLHKRGIYFDLTYENNGAEWCCWLNDAIGDEPASVDLEIEASSAPLAICRAALKVTKEET